MNIQKMMKQAQDMQAKMGALQAKLEEAEMEGASGSGMVKITLTGKKIMRKISIDESLLVPADKEMLEDLIIAAYNDASGKIDNAFSEQMSAMTAVLSLPPGFKMPF